MDSRARTHWQRLSLATRFAVSGGIVLAAATLLIGAFVVQRIEESVVRHTAAVTALYMESIVSPLSQHLADTDVVSDNARRALDEVFTNTPLGERVVAYKIWKNGGLVIESSDETIIGRTFPVSPALTAAWAGEVGTSFDEDGDDDEIADSDAAGLPLLEVYSPIREAWSGEIIAVVEFYEVNPQLAEDLVAARRSTWLTVAAAGLAIGTALYLIVLGGSRTIERQRRDLDARMEDLRQLLGRNRDLRLRVQEAAGRSAATNEHALRRIGADLHDGPAQYLAFAALRLDDLRDEQSSDRAVAELDGVKDALARAMGEVRAISRGLTLPDIASKPPGAIVCMAVDDHRTRTGEAVAVDKACDDPVAIDQAQRICCYRFVQEGLNNASRHAGGAGLTVTLDCGASSIRVRVLDRGPGMSDDGAFGLGLSGLRDRIESLGGAFGVARRPGGGTELWMDLVPGDPA